MGAINAIIFKESEEHGELIVEFTDGNTSMEYFFNTSRDGREVLNGMPIFLAADMHSKGLTFNDPHSHPDEITLSCAGSYEDLYAKFDDEQIIAIFYALYSEYIPSDLDVLISALEMRLSGRRPLPTKPGQRRKPGVRKR